MAFFGRIKKLASETAIYGLSSIIGRLINVLLLPFYSWVFEPDQYGVQSAIYAALIFMNVVYTFGMESAYLKFAAGTEGRHRANTVFSTVTMLLLCVSIVLSLLFVFLRVPASQLMGIDPQWYPLLYFAAAILFVDTMTTVPFAELRLQNRPLRFAVTRLTGIVFNVGLNIVLIVGLGMGIEGVFIANLAASAVMLLMLAPIYVQRFRPVFSTVIRKELLQFGLPFLPSGLGYAVTERVSYFYLSNMDREQVIALYGHWFDSTALSARASEAAAHARDIALEAGHTLNDPETLARVQNAIDSVYGSYAVGIFSASYKLAIFMMLVAQMFRFAWQPFFLHHAEDEDAKPLFARVFTLFTAIGLSVVLAVTFFKEEIVAFPVPRVGYLINPEYWLGLHIVPVVLVAYLFQGWYYNFSAGLYIEKKTKYFVHNTLLGAMVTLVVNILFVPYFGMMASAWASLLAYGTMAMALYFTAQRFYPIAYEWGKVLRMMALAGGLYILWVMFPALQVWWLQLILLAGFAAGLVGLDVVPAAVLRRTLKRNR